MVWTHRGNLGDSGVHAEALGSSQLPPSTGESQPYGPVKKIIPSHPAAHQPPCQFTTPPCQYTALNIN